MKNIFIFLVSCTIILSCSKEEDNLTPDKSLESSDMLKEAPTGTYLDKLYTTANLIAIKKSNTGTLSTEVHILNGASKFQSFLLHTGTALHETDNTFDFCYGDYNYDGINDLIAIKKSNTGTSSTEVHILNGANKFQSFLLHTGTALHETDNTFDFCYADYNYDGVKDLIAIKKSNTGTSSTEVHVLNGANKFQSFILHTGTALHETDNTFDFCYADYNNDGAKDLIAIKKSNTGTSTTEVHVLNGANKFQSFILHTGTALHETGDNFNFLAGDYNLDGHVDIYAIKKSDTGTSSTEVHVLNGANKFQNFILQTGTALHETDDSFAFSLE